MNTNLSNTRIEQCNALSVDVEDYYQVSAFSQQVSPNTWESYSPRVARNTYRLLEMFERLGVKGTFFVLGWVAERNRELVEAIYKSGHEVACHGYSHALVFDQTAEQFREETRRAKHALEDIIGVGVNGYRAASFSIVERSRWAIEVLADEGFVYDSSIYPVRHDRYGVVDAPCGPHRLGAVGDHILVEFPPGAFELLGLRFPFGGGGYFRLYPYWLTRKLLKSVNRGGRPCMCYFHPWEIDPSQPRLSGGVMSCFRHYVNLAKTEARLERLLQEFRFAPVMDVLQEMGMVPAITPGEEAAA